LAGSSSKKESFWGFFVIKHSYGLKITKLLQANSYNFCNFEMLLWSNFFFMKNRYFVILTVFNTNI
jgi:hypothetical protein